MTVRFPRRMTFLASGITGALVVGAFGALAIAPAANASVPHHVYRTDGDGVWLHSVPSIHGGLIKILPEGTAFDVDCYVVASDQAVDGNPVWLRGTSPLGTGYATDYYIDTHWNKLSDLDSQGIHACDSQSQGAATPAVDKTTTTPSPNVTLKDGQSARGSALAKLVPTIEKYAGEAGVNGQNLARIVYHEGGNYLSIRRAASKAVDRGFGPSHSVGIAQIKPNTARTVLRDFYKDSSVDSLADTDLRNKLVDSDEFSIKIAAGYVRLLQNAGISGDWPQFMAYSLSVSQAVKWKAAGHPMTESGLHKVGFVGDVSKFIDRQQKYNDAKNAIG